MSPFKNLVNLNEPNNTDAESVTAVKSAAVKNPFIS